MGDGDVECALDSGCPVVGVEREQGGLNLLGLIALQGVDQSLLELRGDGPVYCKAGPRIVVYDVADLEAWLAGRKRRSTSEADQEEARS